MFGIHNKTQENLPQLPFEEIKNVSLGNNYDLSLIIVDESEIRELNTKYRQKNEATDILSFPVSDSSGEIYINLEQTRQESKKFAREFENFLAFIFIHGCVHLKGYDHGAKMEAIEQQIRRKFDV